MGFLKLPTISPTRPRPHSPRPQSLTYVAVLEPQSRVISTRSLSGPFQARLQTSEAYQSPWKPLVPPPPSGSLCHTRCSSCHICALPPPPLPSRGAASKHLLQTLQLRVERPLNPSVSSQLFLPKIKCKSFIIFQSLSPFQNGQDTFEATSTPGKPSRG